MQLQNIDFEPQCPRWYSLAAKFFTLVAVSFGLQGCISAGNPPESWPTPVLAERNACPDLSGTYENRGIDPKGENTTPLALIVFPEVNKNWTRSQVTIADKFRKASHLIFAGPNLKGLKIEAWRDDELLAKIERGVELGNGYRCNGDALDVSLPARGQAQAGIFFDVFNSAAVMRASDGSLLVKTSGLGVGLGFYLIPLAGSMEGLGRYLRINRGDSAK